MAESKIKHIALKYGKPMSNDEVALELHTDFFLCKSGPLERYDCNLPKDWQENFTKQGLKEIIQAFLVAILVEVEGIEALLVSDTQITFFKFVPSSWEDIEPKITELATSHLLTEEASD